MHTLIRPIHTSFTPSSRRTPLRALRWAATALAVTGLLHACGGGGGGGGSNSSSEAAGVPNAGATPTSTWPFPFGMSVASPTALAPASEVVSGGLGIDNLGLNTTMTTLQAVRSSQTEAVAAGRLSLSGSGLVDVATLFDTSVRSHASCYGQTVAYAHHDNASGASANGTLPSGEVAIWRATDDSASPQACAVAEVNAQSQALAAQAHQATLLLAALRNQIANTGSTALPAEGAATDVSSLANNLLTSVLPGVSVQSASVALSAGGSEYTYRLLLTRGSGTTAQSLEISMLHTPADTDAHYAGTLRMALSYLSTDASLGCSDQIDSGSGRYKVARLSSVGYNRQDQWLSLRLRAGQYCGKSTSATQFDDLAATAMSGELDPAVYLSGSVRGTTKGWRQGFVRLGHDLLVSAQTSDFILAWQDQPLSGASHARLFAGHSSLDSGSQTRSLALFHGYTNDISTTDGTMLGMACNWDGPGSTKTLHNSYQYQLVSLGSSASSWGLLTSHIAYAPTNSCQSSSSMSFDANGDGVLDSAEGQSFNAGLAVPTGANDVQDELQQQGFLAPVLLL